MVKYSYVEICQCLRSGGVKRVQIQGQEAAGLSSTQLPLTSRQLTL